MKIGIQTISWGTRIDDLRLLAAQVSHLGYQGLEFAQNVNTLGSPDELCRILNEHQLSAVGFAGGSLRSRAAYAQLLQPQYLYIDEWDETEVREAMGIGYTIGIHPHLYKSIGSMREADKYLQKFPQLKLIADTAHLYLAGDNVLETLEKYGDRVNAVHLKDWTSRFGRSPFRFARGFTELGRGELSQLLEAIVEYLQTIDYRGWVIVEQDTPNGDPVDSARVSREWLRGRGQ